MSEAGGNPSIPNGSGLDPLQRLSSFKPPRDLSLGGIKPNKKIFTPNLNVSRNKNKSGLPSVTRDKSEDRGRKDRKNDKNRNHKNGPNIIKSSGVFSEGMAATERQSVRSSYGRDVSDSAPVLQKPTIKVKGVWKIDKELEEKQIKKVMGDVSISDDDDDDDPSDKVKFDKDAPIRLPMSEGGWLHSKPKAVVKVKPEVVVKAEPEDGDIRRIFAEDRKPVDVKKEPADDTDIVSLLRGDQPTLIMLQFPDSLPGCGRSEPATATTSGGEQADENTEERCRLADLEEGQLGRLLLHRSGRVRLAIGDTMFEVAPGTQASFRQEAVSLAADEASRSAALVALGALPHKLNILPHWESMLADFSLT